jgi:ankyrin repeat protein
MFAVTNIQTDSVNLLLDHGADVNATANDGCTALMLAASSGDSEIVRGLLSKDAYVSGKFTATGKTVLMLAREKDYTEIVKLLQAAGAER